MINYLMNLFSNDDAFAAIVKYQLQEENLTASDIATFNLVIPKEATGRSLRKFEKYRDKCVVKESADFIYCVLFVEDPDLYFDQAINTSILIANTFRATLRKPKVIKMIRMSVDPETLQHAIESFYEQNNVNAD